MARVTTEMPEETYPVNRLKFGLAVAIIVTTTGVAASQGSGVNGTEVPRNTQSISLLIQKSVQEELKLSEEQLRKLPEFRLAIYRKYAALYPVSLPSEDREVQLLAGRERSDMIDKELKGFLAAEQYKRLKQINLRVSAGDAWGLVTVFRNSEVAKELNFTDGQKEVLTGIREDIQNSYLKIGSGGREESQKKMAEYREANNRKLEGMLTDAQKAKWQELIGPEPKVKIELPRGGF